MDSTSGNHMFFRLRYWCCCCCSLWPFLQSVYCLGILPFFTSPTHYTTFLPSVTSSFFLFPPFHSLLALYFLLCHLAHDISNKSCHHVQFTFLRSEYRCTVMWRGAREECATPQDWALRWGHRMPYISLPDLTSPNLPCMCPLPLSDLLQVLNFLFPTGIHTHFTCVTDLKEWYANLTVFCLYLIPCTCPPPPQVYSIDGSSSLTETMNDLIQKKLPGTIQWYHVSTVLLCHVWWHDISVL